jgi:FkbM family methyltransferase
MRQTINNFTVLESIYGKFLVNRHCAYQADALIKTGTPHIEPELAKILAIVRVLPDHCVILDAGANIGLVSIPIAQDIKPRGGVVHAFEVQRMMFYALCGSAALNDLTNLHIHNQALGAAPGRIRAAQPDYSQAQDFGLYSLLDPATRPDQETIDLVTIDSLNLPRLDLLKIDVEGMEPAVLGGAKHSIETFQPWCWVEYWKLDFPIIKSSFAGQNYRFFPMDSLNLLCAPAAKLAASGLRIDGCEV